MVEPDIVTDDARISAVEATATKIRRVDEQKKKAAAVSKKESVRAALLRQPGKSTERDRKRLIELLVQLTKDCGMAISEDASATRAT